MQVKKVKDDVTPDIARIKRELQALPKDVYNFFVGVTPIDTGNARKNTKLSGNVINANYVYAEKLDQGYSKQAPKGMVEPTTQYLEKQVKKILGK